MYNKGKQFILRIAKNPGMTAEEIMKATGMSSAGVYHALRKFEVQGYLYSQPIIRDGRQYKAWYVTHNANASHKPDMAVAEKEPAPANAETVPALKLEHLTNRELLLELKRRGYRGKLTYCHTINLESFN